MCVVAQYTADEIQQNIWDMDGDTIFTTKTGDKYNARGDYWVHDGYEDEEDDDIYYLRPPHSAESNDDDEKSGKPCQIPIRFKGSELTQYSMIIEIYIYNH